MADTVVVVEHADAMAVVGGGLDGDGAQRGQDEGGGNELLHGAILHSGNHATPAP